MSKKALVLSGGGSKGAFSVGVLKYIYEKNPGTHFDIIAGTSTGSLIAPLVATGETQVLEDIYTSVKTKDIISQQKSIVKMFRSGFIFKTKRLEKLVKKHVLPRSADLFGNQSLVFFTTVCLQTGQVVYYQTGKQQGVAPPGSDLVYTNSPYELIAAIVASCNQPVLMPPIQIDAQEEKEYVDGGVREYAPLEVAIENGAENILVIVLNPVPDKKSKDIKLMKDLTMILKRTISLLTEEVGESELSYAKFYNDASKYIEEIRANAKSKFNLSDVDLKKLFRGKNPIKQSKGAVINVIRPDFDMESAFDTDGLEFDPPKMKKMLQHGYEVAQRDVP